MISNHKFICKQPNNIATNITFFICILCNCHLQTLMIKVIKLSPSSSMTGKKLQLIEFLQTRVFCTAKYCKFHHFDYAFIKCFKKLTSNPIFLSYSYIELQSCTNHDYKPLLIPCVPRKCAKVLQGYKKDSNQRN